MNLLKEHDMIRVIDPARYYYCVQNEPHVHK